MKEGKICIYPGCTELAWLSSYCKQHNYEKRRERMHRLYHERGGNKFVSCTICGSQYAGSDETRFCPNCRKDISLRLQNQTKYIAKKNGGVKIEQHRQIAKQVGAIIQPNDVVHHMDGNKSNNDPSNLVVLSSIDHGRLHAYIRSECLKQPDKSIRQLSWEFIWQNFIPYCFCNQVPGYHFPLSDLE